MDKRVYLTVAVVLYAMNLRLPFLAVAPLLPLVKVEYGLGSSIAGFLTTIPLLVFAAISPFVAGAANKWGAGRLIILSIAVLLGGEVFRYVGGIWGLFAGTFFIALGIVSGNVLIPALISAFFHERVGLMTSVYTSVMQLTTGSALAVVTPMALYMGWKNALFVWSFFAVLAFISWLPFKNLTINTSNQKDDETGHESEHEHSKAVSVKTMFKHALAWDVSMFMGIQSFVFYTLTTWYPAILTDQGIPMEQTGFFLFVFQIVSLLVTFATPLLATRLREQKYIAVVYCFIYAVGILMTYNVTGSLVALAGAILLGIAAGGTFGVALVYFVLRTSTPGEAAVLSGMGQAIGYVLAAMGPVCVGYLYDVSHNWDSSIGILIFFCVLFSIFGYRAGRNRKIQ